MDCYLESLNYSIKILKHKKICNDSIDLTQRYILLIPSELLPLLVHLLQASNFSK